MPDHVGSLQVWREVTDSESNDVASAIQVTSETSFFELGGNSLVHVKLQMLIGMRFNAKLSLTDLFGAAFLETMAAKIQAAPAANLVDWEQEAHLQRGDFEDLLQTDAANFGTPVLPGDFHQMGGRAHGLLGLEARQAFETKGQANGRGF